MPKNTSFSLGDHFISFIEMRIGQGRYSSASDVVRAARRRLEEQETRLEALHAAIVDGERGGASTPFDFESFISRKRASGSSTA